jgi:SAM-dependent methyltransferase
MVAPAMQIDVAVLFALLLLSPRGYMQTVIDRKILEAEFHDRREADRLRLSLDEFQRKYPNKRFYALARASDAFEEEWLKQHCPGAVALDYCSGLGGTSLRLAQYGAQVYGIDISEREVATATKVLRDNGYDDAQFVVGDAEATDFPDNMFDIIVCNGVLHHLDVNRAFPELARILKPTGKIIAMEPLGYNPVIQMYRRLTPRLRTEWEADHILSNRDLKLARKYFEGMSLTFFHLATLFAIPFIRTSFFGRLLAVLERVDRVILRVPAVRLMAWQVVFVLSIPRKETAT